MNRVHGEAAYVLHRRAWRDTSLIIELFSERFGRLAAVARGARKPGSAFFGLAEPFRRLEVSWTRKGEMATLSGIEPANRPRALAGRSLWCGLYANELILRLTPRDDPEPSLFDAYARLLPELADEDARAHALRHFELALLGAIGVAPDLATCGVDGDPVRANDFYQVDPVAGPMPVDERRGGFRGALLLALAAGERVPVGEHAAAIRLMRQLIEHQLEGRPLKTPSLFRETRR